jgi:hypothetical protein
LTSIAATEEYEGRRQEWSAILQGELQKAVEIQKEFPAVIRREVEQAVLATFLHSQPIGQKALTRELFLLIGATRPDKIELVKALQRWAETSWFLDEAALQESETEPGAAGLPRAWRLGSRPNLRQMHHDACQFRVSQDMVSTRLKDEIGKLKTLTAGVSAAGATPHNLPEKPSDIENDGEFHFAVLSPKAASSPGNPSPEACRYINDTTGSDRPRVYRNAIVLVVPSRDGLDIARDRILEYLGWEEVRIQLKQQELDPVREQTLSIEIDRSRKNIPEAVRQAYCIAVTVNEKNEIQAYKVTIGGEPLFTTVKNDTRLRIQETSVNAEALLPGGPYDLWKPGETSRRLKDLVGAFAQFPQLPKMLNRKAILDTLVDGCVEGLFVLRLTRPDQSVRTFWRQHPDEVALKEPALEVVLPENAEITELDPILLSPKTLPGIWETDKVKVGDLLSYFGGGTIVKISKQGYEEALSIPKANRTVVFTAIGQSVKDSVLWLTFGPASLFAEEIPTGVLNDESFLQAPPPIISSIDILPDNLPGAWEKKITTALAISTAVSYKLGETIPWKRISDAIDGATRARYLETTIDSAPWPVDYPAAQTVKLRIPVNAPPPPPPPPPKPEGVYIADAYMRPNEIQNLADSLGDLGNAASGHDLKYHIKIEISGNPSEAMISKLNGLLEKLKKGLKFQ